MDLTDHAGLAGQVVVHGAELHQVQMGLILVLDLVGQEKIIVAVFAITAFPP